MPGLSPILLQILTAYNVVVFLHLSCASILTASTAMFHFCKFNYLLVRFALWFVVVTNVQARKCLSSALVSSKLIGQLFTFAVHGLVCINGKRTLLIRYFPLASTVHTGVDGLIKFCAQQPPLQKRLQQKGL